MASPRRVKRKPVPVLADLDHRYPVPDPADPFAPLSTLRSRSPSVSTPFLLAHDVPLDAPSSLTTPNTLYSATTTTATTTTTAHAHANIHVSPILTTPSHSLHPSKPVPPKRSHYTPHSQAQRANSVQDLPTVAAPTSTSRVSSVLGWRVHRDPHARETSDHSNTASHVRPRPASAFFPVSVSIPVPTPSPGPSLRDPTHDPRAFSATPSLSETDHRDDLTPDPAATTSSLPLIQRVRSKKHKEKSKARPRTTEDELLLDRTTTLGATTTGPRSSGQRSDSMSSRAKFTQLLAKSPKLAGLLRSSSPSPLGYHHHDPSSSSDPSLPTIHQNASRAKTKQPKPTKLREPSKSLDLATTATRFELGVGAGAGGVRKSSISRPILTEETVGAGIASWEPWPRQMSSSSMQEGGPTSSSSAPGGNAGAIEPGKQDSEEDMSTSRRGVVSGPSLATESESDEVNPGRSLVAPQLGRRLPTVRVKGPVRPLDTYNPFCGHQPARAAVWDPARNDTIVGPFEPDNLAVIGDRGVPVKGRTRTGKGPRLRVLSGSSIIKRGKSLRIAALKIQRQGSCDNLKSSSLDSVSGDHHRGRGHADDGDYPQFRKLNVDWNRSSTIQTDSMAPYYNHSYSTSLPLLSLSLPLSSSPPHTSSSASPSRKRDSDSALLSPRGAKTDLALPSLGVEAITATSATSSATVPKPQLPLVPGPHSISSPLPLAPSPSHSPRSHLPCSPPPGAAPPTLHAPPLIVPSASKASTGSGSDFGLNLWRTTVAGTVDQETTTKQKEKDDVQGLDDIGRDLEKDEEDIDIIDKADVEKDSDSDIDIIDNTDINIDNVNHNDNDMFRPRSSRTKNLKMVMGHQRRQPSPNTTTTTTTDTINSNNATQPSPTSPVGTTTIAASTTSGTSDSGLYAISSGSLVKISSPRPLHPHPHHHSPSLEEDNGMGMDSEYMSPRSAPSPPPSTRVSTEGSGSGRPSRETVTTAMTSVSGSQHRCSSSLSSSANGHANGNGKYLGAPLEPILDSHPSHLHFTPSTATTTTSTTAAAGSSSVDLNTYEWALPTLSQLAHATHLPILRPDGTSMRFGSLFEGGNPKKRVVVVFIRHFWCAFCQEYVEGVGKSKCVEGGLFANAHAASGDDQGPGQGPATRMNDESQTEKSKGDPEVELVIIGNGSPGMIQKYRQMVGLSARWAVYTDPSCEVYRALGMKSVEQVKEVVGGSGLGRKGSLGRGASVSASERGHHSNRGYGGGIESSEFGVQRAYSGASTITGTTTTTTTTTTSNPSTSNSLVVVDSETLNAPVVAPSKGEKKEKKGYGKRGFVGGLARVVVRALKVGMPVWEKGGDVGQLGGEFVFGPGLNCSYAHRMTSPKGHAPIEEVLRAAGLPIRRPMDTAAVEFQAGKHSTIGAPTLSTTVTKTKGKTQTHHTITLDDSVPDFSARLYRFSEKGNGNGKDRGETLSLKGRLQHHLYSARSSSSIGGRPSTAPSLLRTGEATYSSVSILNPISISSSHTSADHETEEEDGKSKDGAVSKRKRRGSMVTFHEASAAANTSTTKVQDPRRPSTGGRSSGSSGATFAAARVAILVPSPVEDLGGVEEEIMASSTSGVETREGVPDVPLGDGAGMTERVVDDEDAMVEGAAGAAIPQLTSLPPPPRPPRAALNVPPSTSNPPRLLTPPPPLVVSPVATSPSTSPWHDSLSKRFSLGLMSREEEEAWMEERQRNLDRLQERKQARRRIGSMPSLVVSRKDHEGGLEANLNVVASSWDSSEEVLGAMVLPIVRAASSPPLMQFAARRGKLESVGEDVSGEVGHGLEVEGDHDQDAEEDEREVIVKDAEEEDNEDESVVGSSLNLSRTSGRSDATSGTAATTEPTTPDVEALGGCEVKILDSGMGSATQLGSTTNVNEDEDERDDQNDHAHTT